MEIIADIFLVAGALGAGFYCFVLGRRLNRFNDLEKGMGGAVAVLSAQVDDLTKTLTLAQTSAAKSAQMLTELVERAEESARKLELQMASLHDVHQPEATPPKGPELAAARSEPAPENHVTETAAGPMFVRRREEGSAR